MNVEQLIEALSEFPAYYDVSVRVETFSDYTGETREHGSPAESATVEQDTISGGVKVVIR